MRSICYIILLFPILLFFSCESEVEYRGEEVVSKMVLNSMIDCTKDSNSIKVSESVFAYSNKSPTVINNPNLEIKVNGLNVAVTYEQRKNRDDYYKFETILNPRDIIEISGNSPTHGFVRGMDIVPDPIQILSVTPEWFTGVADGISYLRTKIRIKDILDQKNYYRIVIHTKTIFMGNNPEDITWHNAEVFVDQEILFKDIYGTLADTSTSMFAIFSDDLIQGQEYSLNVYIRYDNFSYTDAKQFLNVEVHSLSENLYKYLRSVELAANVDHFSEPVKIYSNINGGYGVFGSYNVSSKTIEIE